MCCQSLEIEELKKPMGKLCVHCVKESGCSIYQSRPNVCREFLCEWLMDRQMSPIYRPDRIGVIFMEDPDNEDYQAVCDPSRPNAWRNPLVMKHLIAMAKAGHTVVAKSGMRAWRIYPDGHASEWS